MASKKEKHSSRSVRKCAEISRILLREEVRAQFRKVTDILKKPEEDRSDEEKQILDQSQDVVKNVQKRAKVRELSKTRKLEVEDPEHVLKQKCNELAKVIQDSQSLVVYTGAGISTAASIPDYRGPNGVWTLLQQGIEPMAQDLSDSEPTFTHMALVALHNQGLVKYIVSQNCDGLHMRSGFSRTSLSEVHGNMYTEVCTSCSPPVEYVRLFDVTERTGVRKHKTGRFCHHCGEELRDTIVHFGEKGDKGPPHNWDQAAQATDAADVILCLGTSLKVLKKYPCLWHTHKPPSKRAKLAIVNLQWTPKDDSAAIKINGRCDDVMKVVMEKLGLDVPEYSIEKDPTFYLSTPLKASEIETTSKKVLLEPVDYQNDEMTLTLGERCQRFPSSCLDGKHINRVAKDWKGKRIKRLGITNKTSVNKRRDALTLHKFKHDKIEFSNRVTRSRKPTPDKFGELAKSMRQGKVKNGCSKIGKVAKYSATTSLQGSSSDSDVDGRRLTRAHLKDLKDSPTKTSAELEAEKVIEESNNLPIAMEISCDKSHSNNNLDVKDMKTGMCLGVGDTVLDSTECESNCKTDSDLCLSDNMKSEDSEMDPVKTEPIHDNQWQKEQSTDNAQSSGSDHENPDTNTKTYGGLETATDGTVSLSKDSEDSVMDMSDKPPNPPSSSSSVNSSEAKHNNNNIVSTPPNTETAQDLSMSVAQTTTSAHSLSVSNTSSVSPPSVQAAENGLPTNSQHGDQVTELEFVEKNIIDDSLKQRPLTTMCHKLNTTSSPRCTISAAEVKSSQISNPGNISGNSDNLHLLSMASFQVSAFQESNRKKEAKSPKSKNRKTDASSRTKSQSPGVSTSVGLPEKVPLPSLPVAATVNKTDHVRPLHVSTDIQIPASSLKTPFISSSQTDKQVTTSQSLKPGLTKMITMTVSEYLSTITTKVATSTVTTTTSCPVHGHVSKAFAMGSPPLAKTQAANDSGSVIRKQLMSPTMTNHVNATAQARLMLSPVRNPMLSPVRNPMLSPVRNPMLSPVRNPMLSPGISAGMKGQLPSVGPLSPFFPPGYTPNYIPMVSPGTVPVLSTSPTKLGSLQPSEQSHMQLPIQLPSHPPVLTTSQPSAEPSLQQSPKKSKPKKKKVSKDKDKNKKVAQTTENRPGSLGTPPPPLLALPEKTNTGNAKSSSEASNLVPPVTTSAAVSAGSAPVSSVPGIPNSSDPQMYKFLSECLMRNIQLITGLPVMPMSRPGPNSLVTQAETTAKASAVSQTQAHHALPQTTPHHALPQTTPQGTSAGHRLPNAPTTVIKQSNRTQEIPQNVHNQHGEGSKHKHVSGVHAAPVRLPPPAHQVPPPQPHQGTIPSPAHQSTAPQHHMSRQTSMHQPIVHNTHNPTLQYAGVQQAAHTSGKPATSGNVSTSSRNEALAVNLSSDMIHHQEVSADVLGAHQVQPAAQPSAHIQGHSVLMSPKSSQSSSSVSCPNIVAALGKPPGQHSWPGMMLQPGEGMASNLLSPGMVAQQFKSELEGLQPTMQQYQAAGTQLQCSNQNQEALKKNIQIQNILAHLRKATPGAPLPPYMYDSILSTTTATTAASQSAAFADEHWIGSSAGLTPGTQSAVPQQLSGEQAVQQIVSCASQHLSRLSALNTTNAFLGQPGAASLAEQQLLALNAFYENTANRTAGSEVQPATTTSVATSNVPTALLISSIPESVITSSFHTGIQSSTPESSLSNSASFDSSHRQVTPTQEPATLTPQFTTQVETSDADICYETYLIDTTAADDEATALQQAQAAVLQQLAYTADTSDGTQTVVVMNTQDVAFLDDIECEIEIQDAESQHELSITEGVVVETSNMSNLRSESAATTPSAEVQALHASGQQMFSDIAHHSAATTPSAELHGVHHPYADVLQQHGVTTLPVEGHALGITGPSVYTEVVHQQTPEDGQIGQLGMQLIETGEADIGVGGVSGAMWEPTAGNTGHSGLAHQSHSKQNTVLSTPGWFGKGLGIKKAKRKRSK